jgi:electron transfer flavoprotein beta subunit
LKLVVFVKQVPDSTADVQVENGQVTWGDAPLVINPWDEIAVEAALLQKEAQGGVVIAISLGKEDETEALKHALAMGCDEAILISDPALAGIDSLTAARVLASALKKVGDANMAFFGRQSIDNETGVTAAQTARFLGWPVLSSVSVLQSLDVEAGSVQVERSIEEGRQVVKAKLPVVMTCGRDFAEPRFPSFIGKRKAGKAVIPVWSLGDLGLEASAPVVSWSGIEVVPPVEIQVEMIEGSSSQEIAEKLADKIMEAGVL